MLPTRPLVPFHRPTWLARTRRLAWWTGALTGLTLVAGTVGGIAPSLDAWLRPLVSPASADLGAAYGRLYTQRFYDGKLDELYARFSDQMKGALSLEAFGSFREGIAADLGAEESVLDESVTPSAETYVVYRRRALFEKFTSPMDVVWTTDIEGTIVGFWIRPAQEPAPTPHADRQTITPLRLPFDGEWTVFWGGRTIEQNYHAVAIDQRFAYDFVVTRDDRTHRGEGRENEEYHCFGLPILAPAAGVVRVATDTVPDNDPGVMNPTSPPGNYVVLEHGNGEFTILAHLKHGSVCVGEGDEVEAGTPLGLCGNSGNSSEPHLHFHLQTTADFGEGEGLPAQFLEYAADGARVVRGEPTRGQVVVPLPAPHAGR